MKTLSKKAQFITLRAEGMSYNKIKEALNISRPTLQKWGRELAVEVEAVKRERLQELYTMYGMSKEQRIKELGAVLNTIDTALAEKDLKNLSVRCLLDYKLRYITELGKLYTPQQLTLPTENITLENILAALAELFNNTSDAAKQREILETIVRTYDTQITQKKIDEIESILSKN